MEALSTKGRLGRIDGTSGAEQSNTKSQWLAFKFGMFLALLQNYGLRRAGPLPH